MLYSYGEVARIAVNVLLPKSQLHDRGHYLQAKTTAFPPSTYRDPSSSLAKPPTLTIFLEFAPSTSQ